jgi:hypothetical protein
LGQRLGPLIDIKKCIKTIKNKVFKCNLKIISCGRCYLLQVKSKTAPVIVEEEEEEECLRYIPIKGITLQFSRSSGS